LAISIYGDFPVSGLGKEISIDFTALGLSSEITTSTFFDTTSIGLFSFLSSFLVYFLFSFIGDFCVIVSLAKLLRLVIFSVSTSDFFSFWIDFGA